MEMQNKLIALSTLSTLICSSPLFALETSSCLSSGLANHLPVNSQLTQDGAIEYSKVKKGIKPKVWIYTKIQGKNDADRIAHLWRKSDLKTDYVRKSVVAGKMFYSYKMLATIDEGDWTVEVRDQEGRILNLIEFKAVRKNKQMMIFPKDEKHLDCHFSNQTTTQVPPVKETPNDIVQQTPVLPKKSATLYPTLEAGYVIHQTDLKNEADKKGPLLGLGVKLEKAYPIGLFSLGAGYEFITISGDKGKYHQKITNGHFVTSLGYHRPLSGENFEIGLSLRSRLGKSAKYNYPGRNDTQLAVSAGPELLYNLSIKNIPLRIGVGSYLDINNSDQRVLSTLAKLEWKYDLLSFSNEGDNK